MMRRTIGLFVTLALSCLVVPLAAEAQPATKVHRIGYLIAGSSPAGPDPRLHDFRQGLRDLGYVEGQNLIIEPRYAEESDARLRDLAAELVRLQVEVIVAGGSAATRAAQQATRTIPIVMAGSWNPVGLGFVASLARPGGNITGVSNVVAELPGKRLEILKETVPQSTRIAVLISAAHPYSESVMRNLTEAAQSASRQTLLVKSQR
jgi:putative tryptophan/tyrosine transport system substrate-binding protein